MNGPQRLSEQGAWRLLRVQEGERLIWLCAVDPELRTFVYVPDSGCFHLNKGVYADFVWDHELTYLPIGVAEARQLIAARVGGLPLDLAPDERHRYLNAEQLDAEDVLAQIAT